MSSPEKAKGFMGEFKAFIARGNVLDMAVGVIIGGAFGKISTSLVNDVIMPLISVLTGGVDFSNWKIVLKAAVAGADGVIDASTEIAKEPVPPEPSNEEKLLTEIRDLLKARK